MRIRIKFTREPRVKFLGHLDIMRSFQRGFIRAGVKMVYSVGFNPHQKMNFAQPLGVGVTSCGEYLDAVIADDQNLEEIREKLDLQMGEGFNVLSVRALPEDAEKGMAAVRSASYEITVDEGVCPEIGPFLDAESVVTIKKTKSGESEVDIKPLVRELKKSGNVISMLVSAGSENNLKPDLLMQELYKLNSMEYDRNNFRIKRTELMAEGLVPLSDYQTV